MNGLNDRQRKFCENLALGMTQTDAYIKAGYKVKNLKSAEASASALLSNPKISGYLDTLRKKSEERTIWDRTRLIKYLCDVLEIDASDVINTETGALATDEQGRLKVGRMITQFKVQERVNQSGDVWGVDKDAKFFSKEKAAEMLSKLMGWNEPEKAEVTHTVKVKWGGNGGNRTGN